MTRAQAIALAATLALSPLSLTPIMLQHSAVAYAAPVDTINLTDVPDIDSLPVCAMEDCSDQPGQAGVWFSRSTGDWYLERGEDYTRVIVDNTVTMATGLFAYENGAYVGGYN